MPKSTLHQHLVKPLNWQKGPEGLYPFELFWMEGKTDMEGFGGCFSYCFIKEETQFHPVEGMVVHPYDEVLVFASTNLDDMIDLGAEVSIEIGEERELHTFNRNYAVCIPKGTPHGPVKVKNVKRPFVHFVISMDPVYSGKIIPESELKPPVPGCTKYESYSRVFATSVDPKTGKFTGFDNMQVQDKYRVPTQDGSGMGYNNYIDEWGVIHSSRMGEMGPGNADNLVWLYGSDLLGFELNFLWGHYTGSGVWHRAGESHSHPCEEILIVAGLDADDPRHNGSCVEIAMGEEDERYTCEVPTVYICPRGFSHLPQTTRWADKPFSFIVVNLDGTHDSPWKSRDGSKTQYED
ncbi:MAG: hypothetical protein FWB75_03420 [Oscillospiraceae bacterium]|nr:hypothetical protein [Oscillospiraceae bacterium]